MTEVCFNGPTCTRTISDAKTRPCITEHVDGARVKRFLESQGIRTPTRSDMEHFFEEGRDGWCIKPDFDALLETRNQKRAA